MDRFLKTWRGKVLESENEMNAAKVISLGISLAGGGALEVRPRASERARVCSRADCVCACALQRPGAYQLQLARIRARNMAAAPDSRLRRPRDDD